MLSPRPRHKHASCTSRDRLFVFGGRLADEELTDELWMLDTEILEWKQIVGYGDDPGPRQGASLRASEDGRR